MGDVFERVRNWVRESFKNDGAQMLHFERTVYWVRKLRPDADEALCIAAIAHDVERAFRSPERDFEKTKKSFKDEEHLRHHQNTGAERAGAYLQMIEAEQTLIDRVKHLISHHEVGGDEDQNLLMDADSLSFLENNAPIFFKKLHKVGFDKVREKFDWMYYRISSEEAKLLGKPFYEEMIRELDTYNSDSTQ